MNILLTMLFLVLSIKTCQSEQEANTIDKQDQSVSQATEVIVGAAQLEHYLPLLQGKRVGMVVNQTSVVNQSHLVDVLLDNGVNIQSVFAPEHGFRGTADAGEKVQNGMDQSTGLPIISLYGKNRKPSAEQLANIDVLVFDIQDVGARFYTYISTLEYVMKAAAEQDKMILVLDRPNPNGHYVDGPVLDLDYQSFVGRQQIPIVHGMTVAEYAKFLNGENLLGNNLKANLHVVPCKNYTHKTKYELPIAPSPNLPNQQSILLYPSLCLFEGTNVSVGRGTSKQFQVFGSPNYEGNYSFTPQPMPGAKYPKFQGQQCKGYDLSTIPPSHFYENAKLDLTWLRQTHAYFQANQQAFFLKNGFFDRLAGTSQLRKQLEAGLSEEAIRMSWQDEIEAYKLKRKQYLLYPDFE